MLCMRQYNSVLDITDLLNWKLQQYITFKTNYLYTADTLNGSKYNIFKNMQMIVTLLPEQQQ